VPSGGIQVGDPFPHRDRLCHYQRAPAAPAQGRVISPHRESEFTHWVQGVMAAAEHSGRHHMPPVRFHADFPPSSATPGAGAHSRQGLSPLSRRSPHAGRVPGPLVPQAGAKVPYCLRGDLPTIGIVSAQHRASEVPIYNRSSSHNPRTGCAAQARHLPVINRPASRDVRLVLTRFRF
jgi:hypothetical protein